jgi:DNA-nicking Smr family endonuclease
VPSRRPPSSSPFGGDDLLDAPIAATLDLHGHTQDEAKLALRQFLSGERRRHAGAVVHVITGRGKGSSGGAVLRPLVGRLLKGELRAHVADSALDLDDGGYLVRLAR